MADEPAPKEPQSWRAAAKIGAKMRQYANDLKAARDAAKAKDDENAALKAQIATLSTENTTLKTQVANPAADKKRVLELEGQIRDGKHRSAFSRLAKAAGAAEDLIDDLYERSGYKAEADDVDEERLAEIVAEVKTRKPSAFKPADPARTAEPAPKPPKPVPGSGRGDAHQGKDGTIITAEQRIDPKFMLDPRNKDVILAAAKEGRFR